MERVAECQWDRTLSDGKGDVMIFGNGIFGTLGRTLLERTFTIYLVRVVGWDEHCWNEHLPYTWFEWLAVARYIFMSGRSVNIDIMMPDNAIASIFKAK